MALHHIKFSRLTRDNPARGERWEIYGDWQDDPARLKSRICYGLASRGEPREMGC